MSPKPSRLGFTLIELLVVIAIIALLISILLPSLKDAREQGKKAVCLSNLRSIAQGTAAYSTEDLSENAIPIQQQMVKAGFGAGIPGGGGPSGNYAFRTVMPFAYGGRTAQVPFNGGTILMDDNGPWAARTKPLNRYLYALQDSDSKKMPLYRCPSDQGYPDNPFIYDAPFETMSSVPCYDMLGNSYRFNFAGEFYLGGSNDSAAEISVGPYGHRMSTLENTARQAALMEPLFYSMTIQAAVRGIPSELILRGWHGVIMTSNVGFVDGSARTTRVMSLNEWERDTLDRMHFSRRSLGRFKRFLRSGDTWQMHCYPTPAAFVPKFNANGQPAVPYYSISQDGWPYNGMQDNMRPND